MNKLKHILVPVDLSATSILLLQYAARIARWNEAEIHILHVIPEGLLGHRAGTHGETDPAHLERAAATAVDECLGEAGVDIDASHRTIMTGDPSDCIVEEAARLGADLLVINAHDKGKKRLGRVSSQCVRRAACKTLLVRDWHAGPFTRIAACTDFSELSEAVFRNALRVALSDRASLELIHVIYPVELDYPSYQADFGTKSRDEYGAELLAGVRARLEAFVAPLAGELEGIAFRTTILESADPAEAITTRVCTGGHDLTVIGTTGRTRAFGLHFGSNAEALMRDAPCSVLAVKPLAEE